MINFYIAIDNEEKFREIKEYLKTKKCDVFPNDLIYEEAILDLLNNKSLKENDKNILLINYEIIENVNKFKKLKNMNVEIYCFVSENEDIEKLKELNFLNVYYKSDLNTFFITNKILNKKINRNNNNSSNRNDIEFKDRKYNGKTNIKDNENDIFNNMNQIKNEIRKFEVLKENKNNNMKSEIIVFTGESKSGKTTLALSVLDNIKEEKKILFIDYSYINKDIYYKYNIYDKEKSFYERDVNGNNVMFLFNMNFFMSNKEKRENHISLKKMIEKYKRSYDLIIIDLDKNIEYRTLKMIFLLADKIFFIIEPISLEIYNSINLIELFLRKNIIEEDKIFIIFNKYDYNSISQEILKEVFKKYKIECIVKRKMKYRKILNKEVKYEYRVRE